ncbi:uncharacterized protein LOC104906439 [Beta vulgaris subsp. vulgaris]|uniref:uncharacterized protein LOC104906439 n=1 Tax=Beta vulgaris subsp. vulgaris TaxID=3555 RepID=UPI0020372CDF|nr:uncharacterized protein LOC104906439 [Beta vulgaris subsp. vulgaris]
MDPSLPPPPPATLTGGGGGSGSGKELQKLRLMISYGGHILPRPHDKTLFYAGGETRIVAISKNSSFSLSSLFTQITKSLFNGPHHQHQRNPNFLLKYQLPQHDLDSLISISSDEDLANMIDEYDRISSSCSPTPARIRFFVFPSSLSSSSSSKELKDEGIVSHGLKNDDDWFVDALKVAGSNPPADDSSHDSIVLESSSSFGSTNSSNSPAIKGGCGDDLKLLLPSLDSLGSDCSIPSPNFSQQAIVYQDASGYFDAKPVSVNLLETESNASDRSPRADIPAPVQVSGYVVSKPMDLPQLHSAPPPPSPAAAAPPHYIHHPASQSNYIAQYYPNSIPFASYTPMYQTYAQPQQPVQYHNPYPIYMMPVGKTQNLYDASIPCASAQNVGTNQPQVPPNSVLVASPMRYEGYNKPTTPAPEYGAQVYMPTAVATQPVHLPPVNQPPQPVSVALCENMNYVNENVNYVNEYEDPMHAQIYKSQPSGPTLQMATNAATSMLPENFTQLQVENTKR